MVHNGILMETIGLSVMVPIVLAKATNQAQIFTQNKWNLHIRLQNCIYLTSAVCDTTLYAILPIEVYFVYMNAWVNAHYPLFGFHISARVGSFWNWVWEVKNA